MSEVYDSIGEDYSGQRQTDPYIASKIHSGLKNARSILNIGAGTGSYEPQHSNLIALEPSEKMIAQRPAGSYPAVKAYAEALPFPDKSFSHSMCVLSIHHWEDQSKAFSEIQRVTNRKFIALTWFPESNSFWLTRDYFPDLYNTDRFIFPGMDEFKNTFEKITVSPMRIPANCRDGFLAAYWRRPHCYLDPAVRKGISTFFKIRELEYGLNKLKKDLNDGTWEEKNKEILKLEYFDAGYKIVIVDF